MTKEGRSWYGFRNIYRDKIQKQNVTECVFVIVKNNTAQVSATLLFSHAQPESLGTRS